MRLLNGMLAVAVVCLASAATTAEAQTINACVMKNGILKVLDEGAECLPQETPITLGQPQQHPVETARVFDGNGRDIGAFVSAPIHSSWFVLLNGTGVRILISSLIGLPTLNVEELYFELPHCKGDAFVRTSYSNIVMPDLRSGALTWNIGATSGYRQVLEYQSISDGPRCYEYSASPGTINDVVPVEVYTEDLGVTFPLPLPLWVGSVSRQLSLDQIEGFTKRGF